jgi:hypothetical protein
MLKTHDMSLVTACAFLAPRDQSIIETTAVRYNPRAAAERLRHRFEQTFLRLGG